LTQKVIFSSYLEPGGQTAFVESTRPTASVKFDSVPLAGGSKMSEVTGFFSVPQATETMPLVTIPATARTARTVPRWRRARGELLLNISTRPESFRMPSA
jgi:hypothetical protein